MKKTTDTLEEISSDYLNHITTYKYSKSTKLSEKYKKGRITSFM